MPNNREIEVRAAGRGVGRVRGVRDAVRQNQDEWWERAFADIEVQQVRPILINRVNPFRVEMKTYYPKPEMHGTELFDLILRNFKEIYDVDFVIAGGAVRDLYMGCSETSSDVDVFIPLSYNKFMKGYHELGWAGAPHREVVQPYNKGKDWDGSERASYRFKGMKLDLVFIGKPLTPTMVQSFPIHAQRCVYTLESGMCISPEAKADLDNKKFTISPIITDSDYIKNLQGKIASWKKREAYKDFKIVLPRGNEWWMKANSDHQTKGKVK